jgi:beta-glucanase (GH16 family)
MLDMRFYYRPKSTFNNVGGSSIVQALEFTMSKWSQGLRYEWAVQWENVGAGAPKWRYWGHPDPNKPEEPLDWVDLDIAGELSREEWHHLILEGEILAGQVHYRRFIIDQDMYPLDISVAPAAAVGDPDKLAVAVQLDGDDWNGSGSLSPYEVFLDQVTLNSLSWSDEFNGSSLNANNWTCEEGGHGWGNHELQYYTNCPNATVANGGLTITAKKGSGGHTCWYGPCQYTSARLNTRGKQVFKYGKIEARMKLPLGQGVWPAFWMLGSKFPKTPWPACGEIDVMEHINNEDIVYGTVHWDDDGIDPPASYGCPSSNVIPSLDVTQYHVYDIEWAPDYIRWYVDGIQYCEIDIMNSPNGTEEFQKSFFILLNLAVGGDWPGSPDGSTIFPARMNVDYVRVYQSVSTDKPSFKSAGTQDGWILESSETSNKGGAMNKTAALIYVGDNAQDKQYRSILSFNTAGLPDDAVVTEVQLKINVQGFAGGNMFTPPKPLGNLLVDIGKPIFGSNANLAVSDFQAEAGQSSLGVLGSAPGPGWRTLTLKNTAYDYINLKGATQLRLRFQKDDNDDGAADYLKIYSGNAPLASRPQLIVAYYVP